MANPSATAFAPGSVGNLGAGLDILGLAIAGMGDTVRAEWQDAAGVVVLDPGHPDLPSDPSRHSAAIAASEVIRLAGMVAAARGVALTVQKGLPLSGGQGGSAASAIAAAVATNHLLGAGLDQTALLSAGLEAEAAVAGRHLDNIAPSLMGGLVLVRSSDPIDVVRIPTPDLLRVVLVHPAQTMRTRDARAALPGTVDRSVALAQAANVAAIVAGAMLGDIGLLGRGVTDQIAEPVRAPLLPGFREAQAAAFEAGAFGCSISGSGPTAFALVDSEDLGERVSRAMIAAYHGCGIPASARISGVDRLGARLL